MAFPANNSVTATWFNTLMNDVLNLQSYCNQINTLTASAGSVSAQIVLNMASACIQLRADIATVAGNAPLQTALVAYFQQQLGVGSLQITTEFGNLNTASGNILTALTTDYPHDGSGRLLDRTFSTTTGLTWITLTAAQMPNVMPTLAAYLSAV